MADPAGGSGEGSGGIKQVGRGMIYRVTEDRPASPRLRDFEERPDIVRRIKARVGLANPEWRDLAKYDSYTPG